MGKKIVFEKEHLDFIDNRDKKIQELKKLLNEAYELSTWAASINFDGSENTKEWCDELYRKIENFQKHYEEISHGEH